MSNGSLSLMPMVSDVPTPISGTQGSGMTGNPMPANPLQNPIADLLKFRESDDGKALIAWAKKSYQAAKSSRETEERDWKRNLAMYNGKQYIQIKREGSPFNGQWVELPRDPAKKRLTVNRTEPLVRAEIARLTNQKPSASVLPASSDEKDLFAAMAGEQVWESHAARKKFNQVMIDNAFWTSITGNGIIKTYWDEGCLDRDANMMGDVVMEAISPFNILVADLRESEIEKQPYIINYYTKPVAWLQMFYAQELEGVTLNPSASAANEVIEETYLNISTNKQAAPDSCVVYEYWLKPGAYKALPEGGYFTVVDDTLVSYQAQLPYNHLEYPFAHTRHIVTGKFYGRSVLNSTNELNQEYNSWRTQLSDARSKMGRPQMMGTKGSVSAARWSNQTGLFVEVKPGFQYPQPIPIANLPQYVLQEGETILTDIEDISGQHQVSKGNVPSGVTAATAISYLQEKDDTYLAPTYTSMELACEKVARQTLALVVQFWDVARIVKVGGDDSQFDVQMLVGSEIANGTDIRMEAGSSLPTSKAAKQQLIMDLMNMGAVPMDKGLELLEIGGSTRMIDQLKIDQRQAQRENIQLKEVTQQAVDQHVIAWQQNPAASQTPTGQPLDAPPIVPVNDWDNHDIHIEVHNNYRKSQAFQFLDPVAKEQFQQHVQMHKDMKMQSAVQAALGQIPTDGSVPGVSGVIDPQTGKPDAKMTNGGGPGVPAQMAPAAAGSPPTDIPSPLGG